MLPADITILGSIPGLFIRNTGNILASTATNIKKIYSINPLIFFLLHSINIIDIPIDIGIIIDGHKLKFNINTFSIINFINGLNKRMFLIITLPATLSCSDPIKLFIRYIHIIFTISLTTKIIPAIINCFIFSLILALLLSIINNNVTNVIKIFMLP